MFGPGMTMPDQILYCSNGVRTHESARHFKSQRPQFACSLAAMQRAATLARKIAMQTDTGIVIVQDNEPRYITAEELRLEALEEKAR